MALKPIPTIVFLRTVCEIHFSTYRANKNAIAIWLEDAVTKEPFADVTKYIPGIDLKQGEVLIKNYSENEGLLPILIEAGIVEWKGATVATGFVDLHLCKLLINPKDYHYEG